MNIISKNTALFIFLSLILVIFAGCSSNHEETSNIDCMPQPQNAGESNKSDLPKSNYPFAPEKLMQGQLTKLDGTNFKLADYKGKVVLVNLWATWCGPCVKEMPDFEKLYQANKDNGFEVVGINADDEEDAEMVNNFGAKIGINYQLVKAERSLAFEFIKVSKVDAIPQTFLIDREGRLVGVFVGGGSNVEKIKSGVTKLLVTGCAN